MDSAKLNDWLQFVGMLGLIASLVFVGVQVNQTQRAGEGAKLASYLEIATMNRELRMRMFGNEAGCDIFIFI